jgi:hypothetical protein
VSEAAPGNNRDRWRAKAEASSGGRRQRRLIAAVMLATAVVAVAVVAGLILGPAFTWQTACVTLVIDEYPLGVLEPVAFAEEDQAALAATLDGRLHTRLGPKPVALNELNSVQAVRDLLLPRMRGLNVRGKDVLLAYLRGQAFVAPPVFDDAGLERPTPLTGLPCLLASDFRIAGGRPQEIVPIRSVIEAVAAAPARVTLVALDLGDLDWDPRLGVLGQVVPAALDRELSKPQLDAVSQNWIIGSHDLFQASAVSVQSRRTCFGRALELALAGDADEEATGNGNGLIELDEVVRFVSLWTNEWARRLSGGRSRQTPVVWRLGVGRVALDEIPPGIALLRVPSRSSFFATSKPQAEAARGDESSAAEAASGPQDSEKQKDAASGEESPKPQQDGEVERLPAPSPAAATPDEEKNPGGGQTEGSTPGNGSSDGETAGQADGAVSGVRLVAAVDESGDAALAFPGEPLPAASTQGDATGKNATGEEQQKPPTDGATDGAATGAGDAKTAEAAGSEGDPPKKKPQPSADAQLKPQNGPEQAAARPKGPRPPKDVWESLSRLGERRLEPAVVSGLPAILPVPNDYASAWWRSCYAIAASATRRANMKGPVGERGVAALRSLSLALSEMASSPDSAKPPSGESPVAENLWAARSAADSSGYFQLWSAAPDAFCRVVAIRNEAITTVVSAVDIVGHTNGGAGTPPLDPAVLLGLCAKIAELNDMLAQGIEAVGINRLTSAARSINSQRAAIADQIERLVDGLHRGDGAAWSSAPSLSIAALRSPLLTDAKRRHVLSVSLPPSAPGKGSTLETIGRPLAAVPLSPQLPLTALENLGSLVECLPAFVEAAARGQDANDIDDEVAAVRRDIAALTNASAENVSSVDRVLRLGGRVSHLLSAVAAAAADVSTERAANGMLLDRATGLFRVMDVRDTPQLESVAISGLPDWSAEDGYGLSLELGAAVKTLTLGKSTELRLAVDSGGVLPAGSEIRLMFDPATLEVRLRDGSPVVADATIPVEALGLQGGEATLSVVARRTATRPQETVSLEVVWQSLRQATSSRLMLPLPANRSFAIAARSTAMPQWQWSREQQSSLPDLFQGELTLTMLPGAVNAWEFAIQSEAEITREVAVAVYSIGEPVGARQQPAVGRDVLWQRFAEQFSRGEDVAPPLAVIKKLQVKANATPTTVQFPAEPAPPSEEKPVEPSATADSPPVLGPDLAIAVREQTEGEPQRQWLFRLKCEQLHPRGLLTASAVWSEQTGSMEFQFALSEAWDETLRLPEEGVKVEIEPLQLSTTSFVQIRRGQTVLSQDRRSDTLVASWNGPRDGQPALIAAHVNGYPRAFVFAVECAAAVDGQQQQPRFDWRMLRFVEPAAGLTVLKAPASTVPMTLQIDAPPDAPARNTGREAARPESAVSLTTLGLREVQAGSLVQQPQRMVWLSDSDRALTYTLEKAAPPMSLSIRPVASDWQLEIPGDGFVDVDVEAEARLVLPGNQPALTTARQFVFDGRPPSLELPPAVNADVGIPLVIPVQVVDDPREAFAGSGGSRLPGVSGVDKVEWAVDLKGDGKPEAWALAVSTGGSLYEIQLDTKKLPLGARLPLLVRATDNAGLAAEPQKVWVMTATEPAKGRIEGRVTLDGRGEAGVPVVVSGPTGTPGVTTGKDGQFVISDLEAGEYELKASGVVRNVTHSSEPKKVTVELPPAAPVKVMIELQ